MKTPQDNDAAANPKNRLNQPAPLTQPNPSTPKKNSIGSSERFLHSLFLLLVILAGLGFWVWLEIRLASEVVSRQPIGRFLRMSGPGGLAGDVVIETEKGLYLLHGTPAIAKGTLLILEVRATGAHFICDEARSLCLRTSSKKFKANDVHPASSAPTPRVVYHAV